MEMKVYRETAMRHGDRWLVRKKVGMMQELRKGKGDATELSGKLAILLEVREERRALAGKMRETIDRLEEKQKLLVGKKKAVEKEIAQSEPVRRKKEIEAQLEEAWREVNSEAEAAYKLIVISKNGLATTKEMRDFWSRLMA